MCADSSFAELLTGQLRQRAREKIEAALRTRGYHPLRVVNTLSGWRATARPPGSRWVTTIVWEAETPRALITAILDTPMAPS